MPFLSIAGSTVYGWLWSMTNNNPLSATVSLNAWHLLTITYDPNGGGAGIGKEIFYVDGAASQSADITYWPSGNSDFLTTQIQGAKPSAVTNNILNGTIDELRAYTRVLSAGEIALLYNARQVCTGSRLHRLSGGNHQLRRRRLPEHRLRRLRQPLHGHPAVCLRHLHVVGNRRASEDASLRRYVWNRCAPISSLTHGLALLAMSGMFLVACGDSSPGSTGAAGAGGAQTGGAGGTATGGTAGSGSGGAAGSSAGGSVGAGGAARHGRQRRHRRQRHGRQRRHRRQQRRDGRQRRRDRRRWRRGRARDRRQRRCGGERDRRLRRRAARRAAPAVRRWPARAAEPRTRARWTPESTSRPLPRRRQRPSPRRRSTSERSTAARRAERFPSRSPTPGRRRSTTAPPSISAAASRCRAPRPTARSPVTSPPARPRT